MILLSYHLQPTVKQQLMVHGWDNILFLLAPQIRGKKGISCFEWNELFLEAITFTSIQKKWHHHIGCLLSNFIDKSQVISTLWTTFTRSLSCFLKIKLWASEHINTVNRFETYKMGVNRQMWVKSLMRSLWRLCSLWPRWPRSFLYSLLRCLHLHPAPSASPPGQSQMCPEMPEPLSPTGEHLVSATAQQEKLVFSIVGAKSKTFFIQVNMSLPGSATDYRKAYW